VPVLNPLINLFNKILTCFASSTKRHLSRLSSYLLMSYAYRKFHTSTGKLMREKGFSQGEKAVRDATAGQIKIWVKE